MVLSFNRIGSVKVSSFSFSTILITSGVHMSVSGIEPLAAVLSIWFGVLLLIFVSVLYLIERIERDYFEFREDFRFKKK